MDKNGQFYFSDHEACIDKAGLFKQLYSNIIILMANRMLKLMQMILKHRLSVDQDLLKMFHEVASKKDKFTKAYILTKKRIDLTEKELSKL